MPTILHLSDLHFGFDANPTQKAQRTLCLDGLLTCLKDPRCWKPDYILISGDLGMRGTASDYDLAGEWLKKLLAVCDLTTDKMQICAGNHDSDRNTAKRFAYPSSNEAANDALSPPIADIPNLKSFTNFIKFCTDFDLPPLMLGAEQNRLAGIYEWADLRVLVMNSAWYAQGDKDKDNLWLGLPQLQVLAAENGLADCKDGVKLTVGMLHHPFDWLHEEETNARGRVDIDDFVASRCHVVLTGHTHGKVKKPSKVCDKAWHFQGGATFEDGGHTNSFSLIRIDGVQVQRQPWEFDPGSTDEPWRLSTVKSYQLDPAPLGAGIAPMLSPTSAPQPPLVHEDLSHIMQYLLPDLLGREPELARLDALFEDPNAKKIATIIALGGEGKTSLMTNWVYTRKNAGWPGLQKVFAWSFYSQGSSDQSQASSDLFLRAALKFFGEADFADSQASLYEKGQKLADCCKKTKSLLLLDGLEPLQMPPSSPERGRIKDPGIEALLRHWDGPSLCVITSRYALDDRFTAHVEKIYLPALPLSAAVALLRSLEIKGPPHELEAAANEMRCHALALRILGLYLKEAHGGDIAKRDLVDWQIADEEEGHGHAFRAIRAYAQWLNQDEKYGKQALAILYILSLFDKPASRGSIECLLRGEPIEGVTDALFSTTQKGRKKVHTPLPPNILQTLLSRLEQAKLISQSKDTQNEWHSLDAHPLLREYFARELQNYCPHGWREAHKRVFNYLCKNTPEKTQPTLEDLLPLYQAMMHGCAAGEFAKALDDVYRKRIKRGNENYSIKKLGVYAHDLAAIAHFFEPGWRALQEEAVKQIPDGKQAWLFAAIAFRLHALGRLPESLSLMEAELAMRVPQENWKNAAITASNLSQTRALLGHLPAALTIAQQALDYAEQSQDAIQKIVRRCNLAWHRFLSGDSASAVRLMQEAECLQAENQPKYPLLYSLRGFQYCEILLAQQSSAAEVVKRAQQTLAVAESQNWLLDQGLDHHTLAKCQLLLARAAQPDPAACLNAALAHNQTALRLIRQGGPADHIILALLTHARIRCALQAPAAALVALNEAYAIAHRCGMRLYETDALLTRLELFGATQPYPWPDSSPAQDHQRAGALIQECGYRLRQAEWENLRSSN
ncbi:metallophosphoesterase [Undibacterium luofuense]|uniref:Metallophosphoesterase n=1 Tax=Undibacterium luofuense TaxID=2828733 RepID=A0A941DMT7_9BURK|nr:metallophosphoesterase [Undibacterium luofuense]MBR7781611.1 metallophosphoesterase [Undibacterium luofuense]